MDNEFKVRASSVNRLMDCAHSWEGTYILDMHSPSGPRSVLGQGIHKGSAAFDAGRITGNEIDAMTAAEVAVDAIRNPEFDVNWRADDLTKTEAEKIAATLVGRYCTQVSPLYTFRAVELETKPMRIDCGGGIVIALTGTLDRSRLREGSHGLGIADLKSGTSAVVEDAFGKRVAKTKGHSAQVGTYELLYEHTTGEAITEPAEIIGLKTSGKPEIAVSEIKDARLRMVGDENSPGLLQYAAEMFRSGLFPPNPQSFICSQKYCSRWGVCKFKDQ